MELIVDWSYYCWIGVAYSFKTKLVFDIETFFYRYGFPIV